ncbi:hypothetical protein BC829DRAFT_442755 [Chytridium lagenaria]|nr:hypothetical protein BC829DRAFT_442755 [Chytridium lagenaria]
MDSRGSYDSRASTSSVTSPSYLRSGATADGFSRRAQPKSAVNGFQGVKEEVDVPDLSKYVAPPPNTHVVRLPYTGIRPDELTLEKGDIVGIEIKFEDGWARGQIISKAHKRGMFPLTVLTPNKSGPSQLVAHDASNKSYFVAKKRSSNGSTDGDHYSSVVPTRTTSVAKKVTGSSGEDTKGVSALRARFDQAAQRESEEGRGSTSSRKG